MSVANLGTDFDASGRRPELDWLMLAVTALCFVGLTMAISVQPINSDGGTVVDAVKGHGARLCAGIVAFLVCAALPLHLLHPAANEPPRAAESWFDRYIGPMDLATKVFLVALVVTASTLLFGGSHGARRWLSIGSQSIQPVDFARLVLVVLIASRLAAASFAGELGRLSTFCRVLLPAALLAAVLLRQPDKGNATLVVLLAATIAIAAGVSFWWFIVFGVPVAFAGFLHFASEGYSMRRIEAWWSGEHPMQVRSGMLALESGGLFGQGLGAGWMKAGFVPEARNDFVFTIIGEELGLVGATVIVALFAVMLASGLVLACRIHDPFFRYVVFGCTMAIGLQAAVNLAVTTGIAPSKGIDLPFVSAGGSSLVASLAAIGLIGNAARRDGS